MWSGSLGLVDSNRVLGEDLGSTLVGAAWTGAGKQAPPRESWGPAAPWSAGVEFSEWPSPAGPSVPLTPSPPWACRALMAPAVSPGGCLQRLFYNGENARCGWATAVETAEEGA